VWRCVKKQQLEGLKREIIGREGERDEKIHQTRATIIAMKLVEQTSSSNRFPSSAFSLIFIGMIAMRDEIMTVGERNV
jgi:hypothetical protein